MSDQSISIVPRLSGFPDKIEKAKEIVDWLILTEIIQSKQTDCTLGSEAGYPMSSGVNSVVADPGLLPSELSINGLQLVTTRQIFDTGQNGMDRAICPTCNQNIANKDWSFLNDWPENVSDNIQCPLCGKSSEIHQYIFEPVWGFSDLGFRFWNWPPFTESFVAEFTKRLNCEIDIVYAKL